MSDDTLLLKNYTTNFAQLLKNGVDLLVVGLNEIPSTILKKKYY